MNDYYKATLDKRQTSFLIRKAIIHSNFTINQVSNNLELASSRVIYEWMNGTKLPNLENLANLALTLNKRLEDVVTLR